MAGLGRGFLKGGAAAVWRAVEDGLVREMGPLAGGGGGGGAADI